MRFVRATREDYLTPLTRLKEVPFFGLVEAFDESLLGFQHLLRPHIGEIDLAFTIENASPGRLRTLDERLYRIENEFGDALYRDWLEINASDMLRYREAQQLFSTFRARQQAVA
jgi:hypothetical protein